MGVIRNVLALIGCQPVDLEDWGGPLTKPVRAVIPQALAVAVDVSARMGIGVEARAPGESCTPLLETTSISSATSAPRESAALAT